MNIPILKRPNNYISNDRLNFKRAGPRMSPDRQDEMRAMTSPACRIVASEAIEALFSKGVIYSLEWVCVLATQQPRDVDPMLF